YVAAGPSKRRFSISSHVLPGLMVALDSAVILSTALISYALMVAGHLPEVGAYSAAIAFIWLAAVMLMNFAGLYPFEAILRPLAFLDKIVIAFATTFLFLLAAAFALKISAQFSRLWIGTVAMAACSATISLRFFSSYALGYLAAKQVFSRNVVITGTT